MSGAVLCLAFELDRNVLFVESIIGTATDAVAAATEGV